MTLAKRFMARFSGLSRAHGVFLPRGPGAKGKVAGSARTEHESVTEELWERHLAGEQGLGIVPINDENCCRWGAIDIDKYDLDLPELAALVKRRDLPLTVLRSKSGGAHLYLFVDEAIPAVQIKTTLESWAVVLGHGGVEVFPKQENLASTNDVGNWLNMPYFGGENTVQYAIDKDGQALDAQQFLDLADVAKVSSDAVTPIELESDDLLKDGPPCLQVLLEQGIGEGGRNSIAFNFAVYAKKRYGKDREDIEVKMDDFNTQCVHPPLGSREMQEIVKHALKKDYAYTCKTAPIADVCQQNICRTRRYGVGVGDGSGPPLPFGELVKIGTEPPFYILEVEGRRIELSSDELYGQDKFRKACMERIDKVPPRVKGPRWDGALQELMQRVVVKEAPKDSSPTGQVRALFEQWIATVGSTKDKKELLTGKPWEDNGLIYFRSPYFIKYLRQHGLSNITEQRLWKYLRGLGSGHDQFNIEDRNIQAWCLPVDPNEDVTLAVPESMDNAGKF